MRFVGGCFVYEISQISRVAWNYTMIAKIAQYFKKYLFQ